MQVLVILIVIDLGTASELKILHPVEIDCNASATASSDSPPAKVDAYFHNNSASKVYPPVVSAAVVHDGKIGVVSSSWFHYFFTMFTSSMEGFHLVVKPSFITRYGMIDLSANPPHYTFKQ
jgi:hypothetical protein